MKKRVAASAEERTRLACSLRRLAANRERVNELDAGSNFLPFGERRNRTRGACASQSSRRHFLESLESLRESGSASRNRR